MVFSPLIRAPPNATSHLCAACWVSKTFSLSSSGRWHRVQAVGGEKREWESLPRGHRARRTPVGTASELVLSPCCRHLLFSNLLQFHNHCPCPFPVPGSVWTVPFPLFCPHPFLSRCPCFRGHTQASSSTDRSSLWLSSFLFLLKARLSYH